MPGLGDLLAARVAGEIGEHITQFDSPAGLQCYAGTAPVTRRSGKSDFVVARRLAHNHYLGAAVHQWAFCSLLRSGWAREFYDQKTAAGKSHHAALRALSNRWLEIHLALPRQSACSTTRPSTSPTATAPSDTPPEPEVDRGCLTGCPARPSGRSGRATSPRWMDCGRAHVRIVHGSRPLVVRVGIKALGWCYSTGQGAAYVAGRADSTSTMGKTSSASADPHYSR